jgi:hypothetical protein
MSSLLNQNVLSIFLFFFLSKMPAAEKICKLADEVSCGQHTEKVPLADLYTLLSAALERVPDGENHHACAVEWRLARVIHDLHHGIAPGPGTNPIAVHYAPHVRPVPHSPSAPVPHGTRLSDALDHARRAVALRPQSVPANLWRGAWEMIR